MRGTLILSLDVEKLCTGPASYTSRSDTRLRYPIQCRLLSSSRHCLVQTHIRIISNAYVYSVCVLWRWVYCRLEKWTSRKNKWSKINEIYSCCTAAYCMCRMVLILQKFHKRSVLAKYRYRFHISGAPIILFFLEYVDIYSIEWHLNDMRCLFISLLCHSRLATWTACEKLHLCRTSWLGRIGYR